MSSEEVLNTASQAFSIGIIVAIVVGSVIGLAILICILIILYCVCCRKKKTYPGAIIQPPSYPESGYYNQAINNV